MQNLRMKNRKLEELLLWVRMWEGSLTRTVEAAEALQNALKPAGEDYSAWEAEYAKFPKLESLTLASSEARSRYS